jgi:transcriptional regulator with XRE-family HTH domain
MHKAPDVRLDDARLLDIRKALGRRIEELRERQRLRQYEAAEHAGMNQGHWSKIERGELDLRLSTLLRVQYALGLDYFESLFGEGPSQRLLKSRDDDESPISA